MRRPLLLIIALVASGCVTRVNSPSVRPDYVAAPSGAWQEILLELMVSVNLEQYRSPEVRMGSVDRVRTRQHTDRKGFLWRRQVLTDTVEMRYQFRGSDSWTALASARFVQTSDVTTPIRIGGRSDDEDENDDRIWHHRGFHSTQRLQVGSDSSDVWELVSRWEYSQDGVGAADQTLTLRHGDRAFRLLPVTPSGPDTASRLRGSSIIPRARGWMLEENGLPYAVVQANGGGILGNNDTRAWVPAGLTPEERHERVAVLMMLLIRDSRMPFRRAH